MNHLDRGLYVSCQPATGNEPFYDFEFIKRFALAAESGGAKAVRIEGKDNVKSLLPLINIPIIALLKKQKKNFLEKRNITISYDDIFQLYSVGARIIAVDFTFRENCDKGFYAGLMKRIRLDMPDLKIFADISTIEEAFMAENLGVDYISTTLTGYTEQSKNAKTPNFTILEEIKNSIKIPYIAEGGFANEKHIQKILELDCYGVVIGTAITRPHVITANFVKQIEGQNEKF